MGLCKMIISVIGSYGSSNFAPNLFVRLESYYSIRLISTTIEPGMLSRHPIELENEESVNSEVSFTYSLEEHQIVETFLLAVIVVATLSWLSLCN